MFDGNPSSVEYPTPQWLADELAAEFGPFDLDPASTRSNAKAPLFYTEADDGLSLPWKGRVWLNPPYGRTIGQWTRKAAAEVAAGNCDLVVALVPVRAGAAWYREARAAASLERVFPGRPIWPRAAFSSAVLVFGRLPGRHSVSHLRCAICDKVFWARAGARTCGPRCRKALSRRKP